MFHDVSRASLRDLAALGYQHVELDELVSMRIHGVSVDDVNRMKSRDKDVSIDDIVDMKIHGRG